MQPLAIDVIKRRSKKVIEGFDPGKLYASIFASCMSVKRPDGLADDTSRQVCTFVITWCKNKQEITSRDIRTRAFRLFNKLDPDAAYIYKNYKNII